MLSQTLAVTVGITVMIATSASAMYGEPPLPGECQGACIVKKIDDFLIVEPDWLPVRAPEPGEPSGPPDIVF